MSVRAVVFDLDDTLIVEEVAARASLRSTAVMLPRVDADSFVEATLSCARTAWRAGPHHGLALELGIASWEALWSSFAGGEDHGRSRRLDH
jgi:FMN phosphatase YigB (HAD superfamily)